jgi:hypothetical protein
MVACLAISAITLAIAGMGVVQMVQGYLALRASASTTQKAEIALSIMNQELLSMTCVASASNNSISFTSTYDAITHTISLNGTTLQRDTSPLMDNVKSFTLLYIYENGSVLASPQGSNPYIISISIVVIMPNGGSSTYTDTVYIQNPIMC